MIFFKQHPLINAPSFPEDALPSEIKIVVALLIQEHGVKWLQDKGGYEIKSTIFKNNGFGDVLLFKENGKQPRENVFTILNRQELPSQATTMANNLETKYTTVINGAVRWTGNSNNPGKWHYAKWPTFADFWKYIKVRLGLGMNQDAATLDAKLTTYSGGDQRYKRWIHSLAAQVTIATI